MAELHRAVATLRLTGDDLVPAHVAELLGSDPSKSWAKGDLVTHSPKVGPQKKQFGLWSLEASSTEPADLNVQVLELLGQLTQDLEVWQRLADQYEPNLFCGWFMERWNEGVFLTPETLAALGVRGISLDIDLYGPANDD